MNRAPEDQKTGLMAATQGKGFYDEPWRMDGRNKRMDERRDVDLDGDRRTGGGPAGRFDY
jgi:hypothetical protein